MSASQVNDARLYRGLDVLLAHKDRLCAYLLEKYRDWSGMQFEFLLYEVTTTYFEGQALDNEKAALRHSRGPNAVRNPTVPGGQLPLIRVIRVIRGLRSSFADPSQP